MAWFTTSEILEQHRGYLKDQYRQIPFLGAIREVVKPGDVVLDIGSGTAVLGILACQAGARRVYSIERGGIIELARKLAAANGCSERIVFVPGMSTSIVLPERGDVAIADQAGGFGFEAGVIEYFNDARRRLLKPGARTIPQSIESFIAALEYPEGWARVDFWSQHPSGLDMGVASHLAANDVHFVSEFNANNLLTERHRIASFDLRGMIPDPTAIQAELKVNRAGILHGLGGWFTVHLSDNHTLTNSPLVSERIDRCPIYFPIKQAVAVSIDDRISVSIRVLFAAKVLTWEITVSDARGTERARFRQSTFASELVSREERGRRRPDAVPRLSSRGRAELLALQLINGRASVDEIANEIYSRNPSLFADLEVAREVVMEVVRRYGE